MINELHKNSILSDLYLIEDTLDISDDFLKVYTIFEKEKNIPGIMLSRNGEYFGVLSRVRFFEAMSQQFMYDIYSRRKIEFFFEGTIDEQQLILDSSLKVIDAVNAALNRKDTQRYEPIVVHCGQNVYKLLDFYSLLLAQNRILILMNDLLQKANDFKNEVLAIVAHDLRNPIGAILGFSDLITELPENDSESKPYAQLINQAAQHMEDLVNGFLVSAINNAVEFDIVLSEFDIKEHIVSVVSNYKHLAHLKNQKIIFKCETDHTKIASDKLKVTEVFENLLSNAVKYSANNKSIFVYLERDSNNFIIRFKDQGPGFNDEDMKKMYGKFQRLSARPTGNESSTGLGLFTVKKIVDKLKGTIHVETGPEEGSTFMVSIPVSQAPVYSH